MKNVDEIQEKLSHEKIDILQIWTINAHSEFATIQDRVFLVGLEKSKKTLWLHRYSRERTFPKFG